ncbi:MAG: hypothetical protein J7639_02550 [Paenibacillaceae bacterium]|nr:hypothetical protein [Paenibacillaceae bacterium]
MKETFIVKHAVGGKIYIDTAKRPLAYKVTPHGDGWKFVVQWPNCDDVAELLRLKQELNVFLFHEYADRPTRKTWYYVSDGPVAYDPGREVLTIVAASRIEYVPDDFLK